MATVEQALEAARLVPIFPCRAKDTIGKSGEKLSKKRPHIKEFKKRATQNPTAIKSWWKRWPNALIGMPTGSPTGIYVIDFDAAEGEDPYDMIAQLPGSISEFATMQRTRRGLHVFYRMDPDRPLRNGTNVFDEGIDTRGEGGYVIIAPSQGYKMIGSLEDLAPVPEWVYKFLERKATAKRQSRTKAEAKDPETVIKTLRMLDPKEFNDYESWTRIMLACFHASDGDESVRDAFKDWSAGDEDKYDEFTDHQIDTQWAAAATDIEDVLTYKTLMHYVVKRHGAISEEDIDELESPSDAEGSKFEIVRVGDKLKCNSQGKTQSTSSNLHKIFHSECLKGKDNVLLGLFQYNELSNRVEFADNPPWAEEGREYVGKEFDDVDLTDVDVFISDRYDVDFGRVDIGQAVKHAACRYRSYHPVRDWLDSLEWDGVERLTRWLPDLVQTKDTPYYHQIGRRFLISAVARAYDPGCQVDTMPVLEGDQGIYKTSLVKALGGDWYRAPSLRDLSSKESLLNCLGAWFIEVEEMGAIKHGQIDFIKKFITSRSDAVRFAYDRYTTDVPRGFVLIGSMNPTGDNQYVYDVTGARRFWPVKCPKRIRIEQLKRDRSQLFAQAVHEYRKGEHWWMTDREIVRYGVDRRQKARQVEDPWVETVRDLLYYGEFRDAPTIMPQTLFEHMTGSSRVLTGQREANRLKRIMMNTFKWQHMTSRVDEHGEKAPPRRRYVRPQWELDFK